jgi:hypothetical protein
VYVVLANLSQQEIILPQATVIGVAEEISPCVVAAINNNEGPENTSCLLGGRRERINADAEAKYDKYLDSVL